MTPIRSHRGTPPSGLVLLLLLPALTALGTAAPDPAAAQRAPATGEPISVHPEAREAIDALKSPYCPGMMLEVCPSPGGAMLRDTIQARAQRGMSSEAIVEGILAEYGEEWRAEPRTTGAGLWAWLLPPLALVGGLALVAAVLAGRRSSRSDRADGPSPDPEEEARLRAALRQLDEEEEPVF